MSEYFASLPKSPEFLYKQTKDKTGGNNPNAKSIIVKDTHTQIDYTFSTAKRFCEGPNGTAMTAAAKFMQGDRSNICKALNNNRLYKN